MSKPKFPMTVKRGHTVVKIYLTPSRNCEAFTVIHYLGTKRQRKTFADLGLAMTEAETIANKLSTGEVDVLTLTSADRLAYVRAVEALKPTGQPLEVAAIHYAEAFKILEGDSLIEAARYYAKRHPSKMPKKTVPEVVKALLESKEQDGVSDVYLKDLKGRLGRFKQKFTGKISLVTGAEIEDFLRGLKSKPRSENEVPKALSGKSRNNYRRAIGTMFNFAEARGYLPRGLGEMDSVALAKVQHGEIEIFRPDELVLILENAEPALIPFLTIGAFAGLRHAEILRLDWSDVRLEDGFIEVKASNAKTASRRLVPIQDNLKRWLASHRKKNGQVCKYANMTKQLLWLAEAISKTLQEKDPAAKFAWKHNALRHSFISYRVAQTQNVAQVALEAGNSPRVVFSNYRELVRPADAAKWFGIAPDAEEKVIPMSAVAAA